MQITESQIRKLVREEVKRSKSLGSEAWLMGAQQASFDAQHRFDKKEVEPTETIAWTLSSRVGTRQFSTRQGVYEWMPSIGKLEYYDLISGRSTILSKPDTRWGSSSVHDVRDEEAATARVQKHMNRQAGALARPPRARMSRADAYTDRR